MTKLKSFILSGLLIILVVGCAGSAARKQKYETKENLKQEITYGRLLAEEILKKYPMLKNDVVNRYVNLVGKSVALFSGRSDIVYHFAVLDSDSINAYATPGGYVFITKGALMAMKNEAELAGVLAHEIGHINFKHILKELPPPRETTGFVDRIAAVLLSQGTFVSSAFNAVVGKAAKLLFETGYKKESEYEADQAAVFYANETGYYPGGLKDFLERIDMVKKRNSKTVVYNTHPKTRERIQRIQKIISSNNLDTKMPVVRERFETQLKPVLNEMYKIAIELEYGRAVAHRLIKKYKTIKNRSVFTYVNSVGKSIALFSGKTDFQFQFEILDTEKVGTFSAPGGYIFITKGALRLLKSESELAALLAFEISHINNRNILKRYVPPADYFDKQFYKKLAGVADKAVNWLVETGQNDAEKMRADKASVNYLSETGYYPAGMLEYLRRLQKVPENKCIQGNRYLSNRIRTLQSYIKSGGYDLGKPKVTGRFLAAIKLL